MIYPELSAYNYKYFNWVLYVPLTIPRKNIIYFPPFWLYIKISMQNSKANKNFTPGLSAGETSCFASFLLFIFLFQNKIICYTLSWHKCLLFVSDTWCSCLLFKRIIFSSPLFYPWMHAYNTNKYIHIWSFPDIYMLCRQI